MTPQMALALAGIFASVALLTGAIASLFLSRGTPVERRLRQLTQEQKPVVPILPEAMPLETATTSAPGRVFAMLLAKSPKDLNRLRLKLARAGVDHPSGPIILSLAELVFPFVLAAPPFLLLQGPVRWFGVGIGAAAGFFGPGLLIERRIKSRQRDIQDGLPDALDLMVVCLEAGSGLDQAIVKTADELSLAYPLLGEELRQVNAEIRAGKPRMEAFKALAQRTKIEDMRSLVGLLIQTDRFGTSISQALRSHAETSRQKRRQRAEEAAEKIGVKLVFPLVLCFFPALYVVVLGPAVIQFVRTMMQQ